MYRNIPRRIRERSKGVRTRGEDQGRSLPPRERAVSCVERAVTRRREPVRSILVRVVDQDCWGGGVSVW